MKKMGLCLALFALLLSLSGCAGVESALHGAGDYNLTSLEQLWELFPAAIFSYRRHDHVHY